VSGAAASGGFVLANRFVVNHAGHFRIPVIATVGNRLGRRFVIHERQADLLEVIAALHASRRFASRLHGREQQSDQNTNDGDNNQQFDESKAARLFPESALAITESHCHSEVFSEQETKTIN
jgi:hypothetical protein